MTVLYIDVFDVNVFFKQYNNYLRRCEQLLKKHSQKHC